MTRTVKDLRLKLSELKEELAFTKDSWARFCIAAEIREIRREIREATR